MKITHSDCSTALKFQWTCIPCTSNSRNGANSSNEDSHSTSDEVFPRSRFHHAACSQGRYVYILGGKDRYSPLKDLWRFDTVSQEWEQLIDGSGTRIPHLQGHTMLAHKSQLLIFGGTFYDTNEDTPLWIYNPELNHMRKYSSEPCLTQPVGRREHSAVIYKNSMYVYGGFLDNSGSTDEFWAFNIEEEEWRLIRRHKPGKRHGHVAVVVGNNMWLHGGMRELTALSDLWTFHFAMSTWNKVKGLGTSPALSNHTAHMVDNSLLLLGGSRYGEASQDVWTFRFDTSTWRHISLQHGDICPPITLHCSVLLSTSSMLDSSADCTKSVPQLKRKSLNCSETVIRPWTSPAANSTENNLSYMGEKSPNTVDILSLDTLRSNLDSNNNKSEEDIHCESKHRQQELETSFCFTKPDGSSRLFSDAPEQFGRSVTRRNNLTHPEKSSLHQSNAALREEAGTIKKLHPAMKLRPASSENCDDDLPLLQRFCSQTSDVDLGENNLTVTLSDENFLASDLSSSYSSKRFGNHLFNVVDKLRISSSSHPAYGQLASASALDVSFENPLFSEFHETARLDTKRNGACRKRSFPDETGGFSSFTDWPGVENIPPRSACRNDMIVEDIESCDIGHLMDSISISYPSSSSLKWSSMKDLHRCVTDINDQPGYTMASPSALQKQRTKSCGSLSSCQTIDSYDNLRLSQRYLTDRENIKSGLRKELLRIHPQLTRGKYIKHTSSSGGRILSHAPRLRSSMYKLSDLVRHSVATQTTGSQLSLKDSTANTSVKSAPNQPNFNHFMMHSTAGSDSNEHQISKSMLEQTKPTAARHSVLGNSQLCILVVGGQTDSHSFQREALKMWRCQLS